jgi:lauroyl/myristoyl acyltransferase
VSNEPDMSASDTGLNSPSSSYRSEVWNLGYLSVRVFPPALARGLGKWGAYGYQWLRPSRRQTVFENLLPVFNGNTTEAATATRRLFMNFGRKLVDLWLFETGRRVRMDAWSGWEHFQQVQARKLGVLLVTAHLGNWELGAPFLKERGVSLLVLTQAEPGRLTEMRQASRARWGIETLVVGEDAFAFIEVIKRLQDGGTVALLMDRPPKRTEVTVELFGRPFGASIAPAELARASGCSILPVYIAYGNKGYQAVGLPAVDYDRRALGKRDARVELTQRIIQALAPAIREHADQWYHFTPIWKKSL